MTAPNTSTKTQLVCVASLVTAFVTTGCASFNGSLQPLAQLKEANQQQCQGFSCQLVDSKLVGTL